MGLLDVNALVALAWDSHVHHSRIREWFSSSADAGWSTCPLTESGFVRVSSNPTILPAAISVADARTVLASLRAAASHTFLIDDVSLADTDVPMVHGYRQVTDAHLLALARRNGTRLVTFDAGIHKLAGGDGVELLTTL